MRLAPHMLGSVFRMILSDGSFPLCQPEEPKALNIFVSHPISMEALEMYFHKFMPFARKLTMIHGLISALNDG